MRHADETEVIRCSEFSNTRPSPSRARTLRRGFDPRHPRRGFRVSRRIRRRPRTGRPSDVVRAPRQRDLPARCGRKLGLEGALIGHAGLCEVTLVDGLVLARSTFHHSINYRSVVIFGTATEIIDNEDKRTALSAIVEQLVPGRGADARPPNDTELRTTRVISVALDESSAKVRTGDPSDDKDDLALPVWAGRIPLSVVARPPIEDAIGSRTAPCPE